MVNFLLLYLNFPFANLSETIFLTEHGDNESLRNSPSHYLVNHGVHALGVAKNVTFGCVSGERKALISFKASLLDHSNRLSSWNHNKDCCSWQGVKCSKVTEHVTGLDLRNRDMGSMLQGNTIDSSLLELKYLSYLDLSFNDFQGSLIPAFLGSMKHLQHLNLSGANFIGVVPHQLGNLSSLRALDLSGSYKSLRVDDLMWATNLSSLEHLDMSGVNLSRTKHLVKVLNMLLFLVELRLSGSGLDSTSLPHACVDNSTLLTNVQYLDLSLNSFEGEFPCFLQNMTSLRFLDLSYNMYNSDPHFLRLNNLEDLNVAGNLLHRSADWISEFLSDKCQLKSLNVSLEYNKFSGHFPEELGELKQLTELYIESNCVTGLLPSSLGKLRALRVLNLGYNHLSGEIPISLGQLSNLENIGISYNSFEGTLSEAHFAKLSKLEYLNAGSNMLEFRVGYD
ncbi:hypothetical protein DH2020_005733 [Rehmannia glutinosa]|uniref:Leucine-rich repeat-containing N-terminal plant-type domain-containing protein n=1 Tax=Rehmannia glutinosa TaxID=99300 RepID=A0ABR0XGX6_REHGL